MEKSGFEPGLLYLQSVMNLTMIDFHTNWEFYTCTLIVRKKLRMEKNNIYYYYHYSSKYKICAKIDNNNLKWSTHSFANVFLNNTLLELRFDAVY